MLELNHRLSSTNVERPQVRADLRISQSSGAASHCISVSGGPLAEKKHWWRWRARILTYFNQQITKNFNHLGFNRHLCRTMKNLSNHVLLNQLQSVRPRHRLASVNWTYHGSTFGEWPGYDLWRCRFCCLSSVHFIDLREIPELHLSIGRDKNIQNPPEKRPCASEETEQYSRAHCRTAAKAQLRSIKYGDSLEWWDDHHLNAFCFDPIYPGQFFMRFEDDPAARVILEELWERLCHRAVVFAGHLCCFVFVHPRSNWIVEFREPKLLKENKWWKTLWPGISVENYLGVKTSQRTRFKPWWFYERLPFHTCQWWYLKWFLEIPGPLGSP